MWGSVQLFSRVGLDKSAAVLSKVLSCSSVGLQTFCVSNSASLIPVLKSVRSMIGMAATADLEGTFSSGRIHLEPVRSIYS